MLVKRPLVKWHCLTSMKMMWQFVIMLQKLSLNIEQLRYGIMSQCRLGSFASCTYMEAYMGYDECITAMRYLQYITDMYIFINGPDLYAAIKPHANKTMSVDLVGLLSVTYISSMCVCMCMCVVYHTEDE